VSNPRRLQEPKGWAFGICVGILEPLLRLLTKRRWRGGENIPASGGCVVAANHISHLDPVTCAHFVYAWGRIVRFLAKAEIFDVPVVGPILRSAGQIPVYRLTTDASLSFTAAVEAVQRGECVAVYPEGTITRQPDLWPMRGKTGAARIALATGCPVIPIGQWGAQDIMWGKKLHFPHLLPRKTLGLVAGHPVALDDLRETAVTPQAVAAATDRIMAAITQLVAELRQQPAPPVLYDPRRSRNQPPVPEHPEDRKPPT
jgi:1-acyl-sn-glycerol-3-phosphate acyltransferase